MINIKNFQYLGRAFLVLAGALFGLFFTNVLIGGPMGKVPFMGDVAEMLTLFFATICFVAGLVCLEEARKAIES